MLQVDTARQVVAATVDLLLVHLRVVADTVVLLLVVAVVDTADLRPVVDTADRLPVVTAAVADSDHRLVDQVAVTAAEGSAVVADLVRPAVDSLLLVDRWVQAWATTSTPRCRS